MKRKCNRIFGWVVGVVVAAAASFPCLGQTGNPADANATNASAMARAQIASLETELLRGNVVPPASLALFPKLCLQEGMTNRFLEVFAKAIKDGKDPVTVAAIATTLAAYHFQGKDYDTAAKVIEGVLAKDRASRGTPTSAGLVKSLAGIYVPALGRPRDVVALLDQELAFCATNDTATIADLLILKAQTLHVNLNDPQGTVKCCQAILSMNPAFSSASLETVRQRMMAALVDSGERDRAIEFVQQSILSTNPPSDIASYARKLIDYGATAGQCGPAVAALRSRIRDAGITVAAVEAINPVIIQLLLLQSKTDEALQEARALYFLSSTASFPKAIDVVSQAFKGTDSNLGRANQFLRFQKYGVAGEDGKIGTSDDLRDLLAEIPPMQDSVRFQYVTNRIAATPVDMAGYRRRAEMYLYIDRPVDAFMAFTKSLDVCPMTTNELQSATDLLTTLIVRRTKDVTLAEKYVEYVMFGTFGKDSRAGTSDDLTNPVPGILRRLEFPKSEGKDPLLADRAAPSAATERDNGGGTPSSSVASGLPANQSN